MICREIIRKLEEQYPVSLAEEWDNVGLLVGDETADIKKILVALDVTDETVEKAIETGADLIVTHHPLLFKPARRVTMQDHIGRRILKMAAHHISCYAMHTNFDIGGMAYLNAEELELKEDEVLEETGVDEKGQPFGLGRIGNLPREMTASDLARKIKTTYRLEGIRLYGDDSRKVHRLAICSGSGREFISLAREKGADVYVTGDLDYHSAIDGVSDGLILIDAGHYGTEFGFIPFMAGKLHELFPSLAIEQADIKQPYCVV